MQKNIFFRTMEKNLVPYRELPVFGVFSGSKLPLFRAPDF
jgi:hypothetical protein